MDQQSDDQVAPLSAAIDFQMVVSPEPEDIVDVRKPSKPEVDPELFKEVYTTILAQYKINTDLLDRVRNQKRIKREFPPGKEERPGTSEDAAFVPTLVHLSTLFQKLRDTTSELKAETVGEEQQRDSGISMRSSGTSLGRVSQHEDVRGSQHEGGTESQHEGGTESQHEGGRISQNEEQPSCLKAPKEPRPLSDMMAINQGNVSRKNRLGRSRTFDKNEHPDDKEVQEAEASASGGGSVEQPSTLLDVTTTELMESSDAIGDNPTDCPTRCLNQTANRETKLESTAVKTNEDVVGARDTSSTSEPVENEDQSPSDTSSESSE